VLTQKILKFHLTKLQRRAIGWAVFAVFFITVGLPLMFFYYWFDAKTVKQIVISQFDKQNYSVLVNGAVEPRSWHGLSLFISDLTVFDKQNHKILHINTANCQLSWPDLIIGHYKVKRIAFNGVTFYQPSVSNYNYATIFDYKVIANSEFNNLNSLSITNLNLIESDTNYIIRDANLQLYNLSSTLPSFHLGFKLARYLADVNINGKVNKIENGSVVINNLNTTVITPKFELELQSRARYAYQAQQLWVEGTKGVISSGSYNGTMDADAILFSEYGFTLNNVNIILNNPLKNYNQTLNFSFYKIETDNFFDYSVSNIGVRYEAANVSQKYSLAMELSDARINRNLNLLNNNCSIGVNTLYNKQNKTFNGGFKGSCNFYPSGNKAVFNLRGKLNGAATQFNLSYLHSGVIPQITLSGSTSTLDLSRLIAAQQTQELMPLYSDNSKLPFNWLDLFNLSAQLHFDQLRMNDVTLNDFDTKLDVKNGQLNVTRLDAGIYGGKLSGSAQVQKMHGTYSIKLQNKIEGIDLKKLFSSLFDVNAIRGNADLMINTSAESVVSYEDLHKKLNGDIKLKITDGGFNGVDFSLFLSPENLAAFQNRNVMMTNFTRLDASFSFVNGSSNKTQLNFSSPTIMANGLGVISFANNSIDYKLQVSSILPLNLQKINSISIPVEISGELFDPKIYIQNMTLNSESERNRKLIHSKKRKGK